MAKPSVLVADDHQVVATGIAASLGEWYNPVAIVTEYDEIESGVRTFRPDILVLDLLWYRRGETSQNAMPMIAKAIRANSTTRVVVLTAHATQMLGAAAIAAGASSFVHKAGATADLCIGIREALAGRTYISPLVNEISPEAMPRELRVTISEVEYAIFEHLCAGETQEEAAAAIERTPKDVEYHLARLRRQLGFSRTSQLVTWYETWRREPRKKNRRK